MKNEYFLFFALLGLINFSCQECDPGWSGSECYTVIDGCLTGTLECLNGAECSDNACNCLEGFSGINCENADAARVQELLDSSNFTPFDLYDANIPLDSLYGKTYQGGLIFYLNTWQDWGLIAAPSDQSTGEVWGCEGIDIELSDRIGLRQGKDNTYQISNNCLEDECAAKICYELELNNHTDWFLPSTGGMEQMIENLHLRGLGDFNGAKYWTSTQQFNPITSSANYALYISVDSADIQEDFKSSLFYVRAARYFEEEEE